MICNRSACSSAGGSGAGVQQLETASNTQKTATEYNFMKL